MHGEDDYATSALTLLDFLKFASISSQDGLAEHRTQASEILVMQFFICSGF